jgi:hypothetical protein
MRNTTVVIATFLASAVAVNGDKRIPQDAVAIEKRVHARFEWNRLTLGDAYEKIGKKESRWDKPAREALDKAARHFSLRIDPVVTDSEIHFAAKKAIDLGCDDPMILYLYARTSDGVAWPKPEEYTRRMQRATDAMAASAYAPLRRATPAWLSADLKASRKNLSSAERRQAERDLDAVLKLLAASVAEDARNEFWEDTWFNVINAVIAAHRKLAGDYKAAFDRVDAQLAKITGIEALRLTVKGNFQMYWGWESRTNSFAPNVPDDQLRTFETRLQDARVALEDAWRLKPGEPHVADLMLAIEKSIGAGNRQVMETWFERAMRSDGNDHEACWQKLDWLDPKWFGSNTGDEMLAFGAACAATKNWRTGISLLAADAHLRYKGMLEPSKQSDYMSSPKVWSEIKSVYDEYLEHYPNDPVQRSKYAALCFAAKHYTESHAQFQILGDRLTVWPTIPNYPLATMKLMRDEAARLAAAESRGGNPQPKQGDATKPGR